MKVRASPFVTGRIKCLGCFASVTSNFSVFSGLIKNHCVDLVFRNLHFFKYNLFVFLASHSSFTILTQCRPDNKHYL